jgi:hypothetical protein
LDELTKIKEKGRSTPDFPSQSDLHTLVKQADGLFIYARTAVEYICDPDCSPDEQIAALTQAVHTRERGKYSRLDLLYSRILVAALSIIPDRRHEINHDLRNVLVALVLLQEEVCMSALATLVGAPEKECARFLRRISAVLNYEHTALEPVRMMHASFPDFLSDSTRCGDLSDYCVDQARDHLKLTEQCFDQLIRHLHVDMCNIRDPSLFNNEVPNLKARVLSHVPEAIRYACKFWAFHWMAYMRAAGPRCRLPLGLNEFCNNHLLHWIEALSLIQGLDAALRIMPELLMMIDVRIIVIPQPCSL